jgi:asparagine synthase (glutamine-hydrolysing)
MCGIAGIAKLVKEIDLSLESKVRRMLSTMPWRGPDADGLWSNDQVSLGHVRLSIIDLSESANQPMIDSNGNVIVFNGEIYNYRELRKELSRFFEFKTLSDTEVILHAYSRWGTDSVKRFNGDWAFAIYDKSNNKVFLSRDRFGIKPLYYYKDKNVIFFASEIRALMATEIPGIISIKKIGSFLKFRQIEQRYETIFENIYPLEPGKNVTIDLNSLTVVENYYYGRDNFFDTDIPKSKDEAAELFGCLLNDAVKIRLHADVPVQILLSGGIDSSAIAALSKVSSEIPVKTLSHVFPGSPNDESYYSDMVAEFLSTEHNRIISNHEYFFDIFDQVILAQDFPTYSEKHVARFQIYKEASRKAKVVIEGQGGDEVFGGYGRIYKIFKDHYQDDLGVELLMKAPEKKIMSRLAPLAELHPDIRNSIGKLSKRIDKIDTDDPYKNRQYSILRNNLLGLLHTGDRLQMYNSIEGRYPFLDHRVVEFGLSMPVEYKMKNYDKYLLRYYMERKKLLPNEITRRTDKKGFSTDIEDFLLTSNSAKHHFMDSYKFGNRKFPGLFDMNCLTMLIDEQYQNGINNTRRLLAVYSLIKFLINYNISIITP